MLRKALLLCLLASAPALAQGDGELPVNIVVVKPRTVYLVPGGETKSIRLQGLGFELVQKVEPVLHGAKMAKTIKVEMKTVSRGIYTLLVSAAPDAAPSPDYQVRFTGKGDYIMVPLEIQVIDPKNPPHLPDKDRQNHL